MSRKIYEIAYEIKQDWKNVKYSAEPFLNAMTTLDNITDCYYNDSAKSIVLYFLSNASSYRGEKAKQLKKELKDLL